MHKIPISATKYYFNKSYFWHWCFDERQQADITLNKHTCFFLFFFFMFCTLLCNSNVQRTETRRTSTTGVVVREVVVETGTGREGAGTETEKGEAAENVMGIARTADTDAGMWGKILRGIHEKLLKEPVDFHMLSLLVSLSPCAVVLHTGRRKRLKWKNIGMFLLLDLNTSHPCSTKPCRVRVCFSLIPFPSLTLFTPANMILMQPWTQCWMGFECAALKLSDWTICKST